MSHIDVCMATYRRPALLARLLAALAGQQLPPGWTLRVVVVDNDPQESARAVAAAAPAGLELEYATQPQKNIALTRNVSVARARGPWIAFIDDDEEPAADWLASLVATQQASAADVVIGPVRGELPPGAPAWVRAGRFFEPPERASGTPVDRGATHNALVRLALVPDRAAAFDVRFGLTGGEDTDFFLRLQRAGGARMVWCREALVREAVPPERATARWLWLRQFRAGQGFADVAGRPQGTAGRLGFLAHRIGLLLVACGLTLVTLPLGRAPSMRWALKIASNLGQISSLARYRYQEYGAVPPLR